MKKTIPMPARYVINTVLLAAFLIVGNMIMRGGVLSGAWHNEVLNIGFFIILAVSLNLVTGYLGQLPLGHAGFMAIGAYAATIFWRSGLIAHNGTALIVGILIAGIVAAIFGLIIGIPTLRLRGDYLAIITLGFAEIIRAALTNLDGITNGGLGLSVPRAFTFRSLNSPFLLVFICVIAACTVIHMVMKSRHGRAILSIRENEIAAESCGINTTYYKVMVFTLSALLAGIAGALYAGAVGFLEPNEFDFMMSINILMMVVLGGMGSMLGSIIAAAFLTSLPLIMQFLAQYRMIIFALMLITVMIFKQSGLMGNYDFSLSRILEKMINREYGFSRRKLRERTRLPGTVWLRIASILQIISACVVMFLIMNSDWAVNFVVVGILVSYYGIVMGIIGIRDCENLNKSKFLQKLGIVGLVFANPIFSIPYLIGATKNKNYGSLKNRGEAGAESGK